ncbi:MAG: YeeE/YedE thiosulfate transporter family protein [Dehalococcoidia bacterium]
MTIAAVSTLIAGFVLGYLGQRSRMCFVGAIRDFLLVRDTYLLKGLVAFGLTAWVAFPLFGLLPGQTAGGISQLPFEVNAVTVGTAALAIAGGLGLGAFSTFANGCPFRQHVLAAQGAVSAFAYLAGFYVGAVAFHWLVVPALGPLV